MSGPVLPGASQVVFAAGLGTRLRPLTNSVPKAMVPVLDVPLVDLALDRGAPIEWSSRFVNVSHLSARVREHLASRSDVALLDEGDSPLGTAATLRRLVDQVSETVVTYNCDLLSDISLTQLLQIHRDSGVPCTLAVQEVRSGADIAVEGERLRFVGRFEDGAGFLFLGAACLERDLLTTIQDTVPLGLAPLLQTWIEGGQVELFEHPRYARDTGTLARYVQASIEVLDPARTVVDPPGAVSLQKGLSYVGPGAKVEQGSLGAGAIVLAGSEVARSATLTNCVVWPGSVVPHGMELKNGIWYESSFIPV